MGIRTASSIIGIVGALTGTPTPSSPTDSQIVLLQKCLDAQAETVIADCVLAQPGVEPIAKFKARGDAVVRTFVEDGEARPEILVQYIRTSRGRSWADVRLPFAPKPLFVIPLNESEWSNVVMAWENLPAEAAIRKADDEKQEKIDKGTGVETICIHGWSAEIESNIAGKYEHVSAGACDTPWNYSFSRFLLDKALAELPYCVALSPESFGNAALRFQTCSKLSGNRLFAAQAFNAAASLNPHDEHPVGQPPRYAVLRPTDVLETYISPAATIHFAGARTVHGRNAVIAKWENAFDVRTHPYLDFFSAAEKHGTVRIIGSVFILDAAKVPYRRFHAPFQQVWRRDNRGRILLATWEIGKIVEDRG